MLDFIAILCAKNDYVKFFDAHRRRGVSAVIRNNFNEHCRSALSAAECENPKNNFDFIWGSFLKHPRWSFMKLSPPEIRYKSCSTAAHKFNLSILNEAFALLLLKQIHF